MKSTKKKLKTKHFRYLSKDVIRNPMGYLDDFFRSEVRIDEWLNEINLMINRAAYPSIADTSYAENGYNCRRLIEQIEVAYVLFKSCNLKKQKKPLNLFPTRADYYNYVLENQYTHNNRIDAADALSKFFSFRSLYEWYETMDDVGMYLASPGATGDVRFGDKIVAIKEFLLRMVSALHTISEEGGLVVAVPSYFMAEPEEVGEHGDSGDLIEVQEEEEA